MARDTHSTEIDGYRYEMTMFGATQSYRLFHRLFRMLGPTLGPLLEALGTAKNLDDVDVGSEAAIAAIRSLTQSVSEADLDHVIGQLREATHVGVEVGSEKTVPLKQVFDLHFAGRFGPMARWIAWGLGVQYGSFLPAFATMGTPSEGAASLASLAATA